MKQVIRKVDPEGIGAELGLEPGDILLSINGTQIEDVLDYYYLLEGETITLQIETKDHEFVECDVEKGEDEELGLSFEEEFMGKYRRCSNDCIFCFIDQMPKGMRDTLYFKDDDARLSFLSGNYITMTNMSEEDFQKIIRYRMSPINISVHTTNPELRVKMLKNKRAVNLMPRLKALKEAGIVMNTQIVLCKGVNDGEQLLRTVRELGELLPELQSVSVVPVGLTKFRQGLYPMEPFTKEDAGQVIDMLEALQPAYYEKYGVHFVHPSDEFYITAERELPEEERYDGYVQLDNGVGMMRLFLNQSEKKLALLREEETRKTAKSDGMGLGAEFADADDESPAPSGKLTLVTAKLSAGYISRVCRALEEIYPSLTINVAVIENHFFGENITVTGLLTAQDVVAQLRGKDLGKAVLLPRNMFKADELITLDDVPLEGLEKALHVPVIIVKSEGDTFIDSILESGRL